VKWFRQGGGDTDEGGVFEEHILNSRKLAFSNCATVAHSEGKEITVINRNLRKFWTVP